MKNLTFEQKYALITKNSLSPHITAVITTGIFCHASCRAKKPNAENVIFYDNPNQAIKAGKIFLVKVLKKPTKLLLILFAFLQKLVQSLLVQQRKDCIY